MGRRGGGRGDDRGAAAVEFALVCVPLFLLLFGIIQYGVLFYEVQGASAVVKESATWAAEGIRDCNDWKDRTLDRAEAAGVGRNLNPTLGATFALGNATSNNTVTVTLTFTPAQLVPAVPVPSTVTRTATLDVQNLPADGKTGCPP